MIVDKVYAFFCNTLWYIR